MEHTKTVAYLLEVDEEQVLKIREEGEEIVALVDYGIGGTKKYHFPKEENALRRYLAGKGISLEKEAAEEPAAEPAGPPISPAAAKLAEEAGVDLSQVAGTGKSGGITKGDVEKHIAEHAEPDGGEVPEIEGEDNADSQDVE